MLLTLLNLNFSRNIHYVLIPFFKIQHFRHSLDSSTSVATLLNHSIYSRMISFFFLVDSIAMTIIYVYHFHIVNYVVNLSHNFFQELMESSTKDMNQVMVDPLRVNTNILNFTILLAG